MRHKNVKAAKGAIKPNLVLNQGGKRDIFTGTRAFKEVVTHTSKHLQWKFSNKKMSLNDALTLSPLLPVL